MKKNIWNLYAPLYKLFMRGDANVYRFMYERVPEVIRGKIVLEIATGPGLLAKRVAAETEKMIATDYSEGMIREARKGDLPENLTFEVADATDLPYGDAAFDVVLIANALHVIPNPEKALGEIVRVLRPGGILIAPNFIHKGQDFGSRLWPSLLKVAGIKFQHQWTKEEYEAFLTRNGWEIVLSVTMPGRIAMLYTESVRKNRRL